ncbi:MAG: hypothetical protein WCT12_17935, partial [Verrucomicrobiota bacterium]
MTVGERKAPGAAMIAGREIDDVKPTVRVLRKPAIIDAVLPLIDKYIVSERKLSLGAQGKGVSR